MSHQSAIDLIAGTVSRLRPSARRIVYFNADQAFRFEGLGDASVTAIQPWRPAFDRLVAANVGAVPTIDATHRDMDCALVLLGRQRVRNLATIAEAIGCCHPDGLVIIAADNDLGPASYAKRLHILGTTARGHARVFWARAADAATLDSRTAWTTAARIQQPGGADHRAAPGHFAWDRIDEGSAMLARYLTAPLGDDVADLGAGWGYLARHILIAGRRPPERLDLYEADWHAIEAARLNLATPGRTAIAFHWHDVTRGLPRGDYDTVVMNPPFHDPQRADSSIGLAFIASARAALKPGGRLWLVANRTLPYETALRAGFARVVSHDDGPRYKVIEAER